MRSCAKTYSGDASDCDSVRKSRISSDQRRLCNWAARHAGHGGQQMRRNLRPDDGSELKQRLVFPRQAIDAGRDDPLYGGRNFRRIPGNLRGNPACVRAKGAAIDELPRHLLDEERDLAGVTKNVSLERVEARALSQADCRATRAPQAISSDRKPDPPNIELRQPPRRVFSPPCQQHQQRAGSQQAASKPR